MKLRYYNALSVIFPIVFVITVAQFKITGIFTLTFDYHILR